MAKGDVHVFLFLAFLEERHATTACESAPFSLARAAGELSADMLACFGGGFFSLWVFMYLSARDGRF